MRQHSAATCGPRCRGLPDDSTANLGLGSDTTSALGCWLGMAALAHVSHVPMESTRMRGMITKKGRN
jgi:hypothetical protein